MEEAGGEREREQCPSLPCSTLNFPHLEYRKNLPPLLFFYPLYVAQFGRGGIQKMHMMPSIPHLSTVCQPQEAPRKSAPAISWVAGDSPATSLLSLPQQAPEGGMVWQEKTQPLSYVEPAMGFLLPEEVRSPGS